MFFLLLLDSGTRVLHVLLLTLRLQARCSHFRLIIDHFWSLSQGMKFVDANEPKSLPRMPR